ncbi:MAG: hypothetical protein Roseis2KO_60420 [Roseivirga sp.]
MIYKIPRIILMTVIAVMLQFPALAQETIKCEKLKISFETEQILEKYEESHNETGYDNDDIAVDIERIHWDMFAEEYDKGALYNAENMTKGLGFDSYKPGGKIPNIEEAYYFIAKDEWEGQPFPVFVLFIISPDKKSVYEATVYCYNNNLEEGKKLVESFRLLD